MIIVRLRGGLGNQLFQYAAGKSLALHHNVELKMDTYTYVNHPYRAYQLNKFWIDDGVAEEKEISELIGKNKIFRYINKRYNTFLNKNKVFIQPHYHFYDKFFELPSSVYLSGYWQSEKYFIPIRQVITDTLRPRNEPTGKNKELISSMQSENSVSMHIRRGDYASNLGYADFFGTLTEAYYHGAINKIKSETTSPKFYVFSDDIEWCKSTFGHYPNFTFVDHNYGEDSYYDLVLMSYCKHNVIANSTFSWWGAWLNPNQEKIVIAPKKWFKCDYFTGPTPVYKDRHYDTSDLLPSTWITL